MVESIQAFARFWVLGFVMVMLGLATWKLVRWHVGQERIKRRLRR